MKLEKVQDAHGMNIPANNKEIKDCSKFSLLQKSGGALNYKHDL